MSKQRKPLNGEYQTNQPLFDNGPASRGTAKMLSRMAGDIRSWCESLCRMSIEDQVIALNAARKLMHEAGPFSEEPVDLVTWIEQGQIAANDYNPNNVAPPEMELLRVSIAQDGYTQPIVAWVRDDVHEVVDGFHRNRVGRECEDVAKRVKGYLPVTTINADRADRGDRIAATIRHNRARGKHAIGSMSEIVVELKRRNWSDAKIGKELGMDPDEVLRLSQISGLAEMFSDREFSEAWEAIDPLAINEEDTLDVGSEVGESPGIRGLPDVGVLAERDVSSDMDERDDLGKRKPLEGQRSFLDGV